jgi:endonuclease G
MDRCHSVRRSPAVCGDTPAEAQNGNEDTFHYTNDDP